MRKVGNESSESEDEDEPAELGSETIKSEGKDGDEVSIGVEEYGICPVCREKWQNPAILPSGWVVCWRCGWDAVEGETDDEHDDEMGSSGNMGDEENKVEGGKGAIKGNEGPGRRGKCPITGVYVGEGQLRRVLV